MRVPASPSVLQALSSAGGVQRPAGPPALAKSTAVERSATADAAPRMNRVSELPDEPIQLASGKPIQRGMFLDILV